MSSFAAVSFVRPWRPAPGEWDRAAATHLLSRAGFGPAPGEVQRALEGGLEATLEELLTGGEHDPRLLDGVGPLLGLGKIESLQAWWMSLMLAGGAPLAERVTLMWHDHFATSNDKVDDVRLMHRQNTLFRERGRGDFRELLRAVAVDPAMLIWLDGNENKRGHANENFAREVMELFGLGIGNYTERDIQEVARALTGWGTRGRSFLLREADHDPGVKEIFGQRGEFGGEDAIDLVLDHPACARHIARRLLTEFAVRQPAESAVDELARELVARDWNIGSTLGVLLASEGFFERATRRSRIAGPVELVVRTARALDARIAPLVAAQATGEMGQSLFRPPSVKGWDGGRAWINAGSWLARHNALAKLARSNGASEGPLRVDLGGRFDSARSADQVPGAVLGALLPGPAGDALREPLAEAARDAGEVDAALVLCTALVLTAPEYHLI